MFTTLNNDSLNVVKYLLELSLNKNLIKSQYLWFITKPISRTINLTYITTFYPDLNTKLKKKNDLFSILLIFKNNIFG